VVGLDWVGPEDSAGFGCWPSPAGFATGAADFACSGSDDLLPACGDWASGLAVDGVESLAGEPGWDAVSGAAGGFSDWLSDDFAAGVGRDGAEGSAEAFDD